MDINNKYCRQITGRDVRTGKAHTINVDVYRVLDAFDVRLAALQHLAKKALCAGIRGHKDQKQDLMDIKQSIEQALDQLQEKEDQATDLGIHDHGINMEPSLSASLPSYRHEMQVYKPGATYRPCESCGGPAEHWQRICSGCIPDKSQE